MTLSTSERNAKKRMLEKLVPVELDDNNPYKQVILKICEVEKWKYLTSNIESPKDTLNWLCEDGHEFLISLKQYNDGARCRKCARKKSREDKEIKKKLRHEELNRIEHVQITERILV